MSRARDRVVARERVPVPSGALGAEVRRFALTDHMCLRCGTVTPVGQRPACCDEMFVIRVDVVEPR